MFYLAKTKKWQMIIQETFFLQFLSVAKVVKGKKLLPCFLCFRCQFHAKDKRRKTRANVLVSSWLDAL